MTVQQTPSPRPWYCSNRLVDDYKVSIADGGDLRMYKLLKIIRSILVNVGIIGLGFHALALGADPTIVPTVAMLVLGAYNGIEIADYLSAIQAYNEIRQETNSDD
jgi:hypothetical protein